MPRLLFFSRVALLCNICFAITFSMHYLPVIYNGVVPSTIIVMGNVLAIVINILMNILYLLLTLAGKQAINFIPKWIIIVNFLFFTFQVILLIK
jgi:hypothetical protein